MMDYSMLMVLAFLGACEEEEVKWHARRKRRRLRRRSMMHESIWGTLQHHIDLEKDVYPKLPLQDFFNLRAVCKGWHNVARQRLTLKEPLHTPFFTLNLKGAAVGARQRLDGLLFYKFRSNTWAWHGLPDLYRSLHHRSVLSMEGTTCRFNLLRASPGGDPPGYCSVFHWKRYRRYKNWAVSVPKIPRTGRETIVGMSVEVLSSKRSKPFRLVYGGLHLDTQVYDSKTNVWERKPCRPKVRGRLSPSTGCVVCKGRLYITMELRKEILVYDFEEERWSTVVAPYAWSSSTGNRKFLFGSLGTWNGRIFDVIERQDSSSVVLWELVFIDGTETHEWREYDHMPGYLYRDRMFDCAHEPHNISMRASFCGDFVLVYSWSVKQATAGKFCMYNMVTRNWEKLDVRLSTAYGIERVHEDDSEESMGDNSEESEDSEDDSVESEDDEDDEDMDS